MSSVLLYNAITTNLKNAQIRAAAIVAAAGTAAGTAAGSAAGQSGIFTTNKVGISDSTNISMWRSIPMLSSPTGTVLTCDTTGYFRCGASCSWTVPAGVTQAQFQLWGPGGSTGTNCCCGGAPFGPTGAYASAIMPVVAGSTYTLCAGCAYCCYASQTTPGLIGSPSYVTGPGLSGFCADSGASCVCNWKASVQPSFGSAGCQFPSAATNSCKACGPESCAGWNFCWDSESDSVDIGFFTFSCVTKFWGTATGGTVHGLSGMYPKLQLNPSLCGTSTAAPVKGFETLSQCVYCWNGNSCAGCNQAPMCGAGAMRIPGAGGYASSVYSGCNACYGDSGRMGMVVVTYK